MQFRDYYGVLGVPKSATADEIKRAYRKQARQHHPDLNPGDKAAEAKFKEINEAHEVLGDPDKRRKYDELGANWRQHEAEGAGAWPGGGRHRTGGASYRTVTPEDMQDLFGGGADPFSDFFHTFFGGDGGPARAPRGGRGTPRRGHDVEAEAELTLEEAFAGATRRVQTQRGEKPRTIEVRIPAGVRDGARVRATGEGADAPSGGAAGDLYVVVRVLPHARFERKDQDLHTRVDVPITTAVLGGDVSVPTLAGTTLRLKIPLLTGSGRVFRLRGQGMPAVGRPAERGDLFAVVDISMPSSLSAEERGHYEALQALGRNEGRS